MTVSQPLIYYRSITSNVRPVIDEWVWKEAVVDDLRRYSSVFVDVLSKTGENLSQNSRPRNGNVPNTKQER
jgi:hypothetical protein